jgi:hypothetical protein
MPGVDGRLIGLRAAPVLVRRAPPLDMPALFARFRAADSAASRPEGHAHQTNLSVRLTAASKRRRREPATASSLLWGIAELSPLHETSFGPHEALCLPQFL